MSKKIFLDAFYTQFSEFLDQLITVFPDDSDFPAYKTGLILLRKVNPSIVPTEVYTHTLPFDEMIRSKNEDFLLKHEFSEYTSDGGLEQIIRKLKGLWQPLTPNNKQCIWGYLILLLDLAKRCIAL